MEQNNYVPLCTNFAHAHNEEKGKVFKIKDNKTQHRESDGKKMTQNSIKTTTNNIK